MSPFDCLNEYIEELKTEGQVKVKTIDDYYTKIKLVLDLLGEDDIKNISFKKVKKLKSVIRKYPSNAKKTPYFNGLTPVETIKTNEDLGKPTLSENTLKNYYQRCFTFFLWCVRYEYTVANPFDGNGFKKHASSRTSFKSEHLNAIFSAEHYVNHTFKHAYYYWLPLLGRFTGARINELCQLHVKDIEQIDGIWCFKLDIVDEDEIYDCNCDKTENCAICSEKNKTQKNSFGKRHLPIHSKLIELGFLEYVSLNKNGLLFPELKLERDGYAASASKWFGRLKKS